MGDTTYSRLVLELCCFEWFQNKDESPQKMIMSFRAVLFRMVPKRVCGCELLILCFRAVLFRMVPKQLILMTLASFCFRAVLFRMVPKL